MGGDRPITDAQAAARHVATDVLRRMRASGMRLIPATTIALLQTARSSRMS
jgi:hypothetical protein